MQRVSAGKVDLVVMKLGHLAYVYSLVLQVDWEVILVDWDVVEVSC